MFKSHSTKAHILCSSIIFALSSFQVMSAPIEPIMETIPAGSFEMGSTRYRSTQPVHRVNIPEFSMGKYEVTVSEFRQFVEATGYETPNACRHEMDGWFLLFTEGNWETNRLNTSEYQPVVCINWEAANAYAQWLARETGKPYRLPSEAEWEYAARAGTTTDYYFGDDPDMTQVCEYANTSDLWGEHILQRDSKTSYQNWSGELANCNDHSAYASIVGMYKPNQFGLHDMLSNVLEFLADCYVGNYEDTPRDGSAYQSDTCERRSTRGGSWHWSHSPLYARRNISEDFSGGVDGFRIALDGKAPAPSSATREHMINLAFAQQQEQKRRDLQPAIPEPVTNLTLQQQDGAVKLSWDYSEDSYFVSYRIYRNALSGKMFKLLASNITRTQFIDANAGPNQYEYTVVAVKNHVQSRYSAPVETTPSSLDISSRVEAEWAYSHEGSRVSYAEYYDRDGFSLKGNDNSDGSSDSNSANNAVLKYQLDVPAAGYYEVQYHVSAPEDIDAFDVYNNDKKVGVGHIAKTGDARVWRTQPALRLYLKKGENQLVFKALNNNWKMDWLRFIPSDS